MTDQQREDLRNTCANMLRSAGIRPSSKKGMESIHAFYLGALTALRDNDTYTVICLYSGRHTELLQPRQEK